MSVLAHLERASASLDAGCAGASLDPLLEALRTTRSTELADLIDVVSHRAEAPPLRRPPVAWWIDLKIALEQGRFDPAFRRRHQADWDPTLRAAVADAVESLDGGAPLEPADAATRGALFGAIPKLQWRLDETALRALRPWRDDPRLSSALVRYVDEELFGALSMRAASRRDAIATWLARLGDRRASLALLGGGAASRDEAFADGAPRRLTPRRSPAGAGRSPARPPRTPRRRWAARARPPVRVDVLQQRHHLRPRHPVAGRAARLRRRGEPPTPVRVDRRHHVAQQPPLRNDCRDFLGFLRRLLGPFTPNSP